MKSTRDVVGLPVLAVAEGDYVARVAATIVNPAEGKIDYLLLDGDEWFLEKKCIPYEMVTAIGENAVTTEKASNVQPVSRLEQAVKLLRENAPLLNTRVITRDGRLLGTVTDFYFTEDSGQITGCLLTAQDGQEPAGIIPAAKIITYGRKYLVVAEDTETALEKEPPAGPEKAKAQTSPAAESSSAAPADPGTAGDKDDTGTAGDVDPLELFSEKQRQYLIGKKVGKTIIDANGNIVASEGTVITEDIIDRAVRVDKYVELTMYVE